MKRRNKGILSILLVCVMALAVPFMACASEAPSDVITTEKVEADNINHTGYDVVYVIDNSGSISKHEEYLEERNKAFCDITNLAAGSDIRIGAVYFGDHVENQDVLSLTSVEDMNQFDSDDEGCGKILGFLDKERDENNDHTNIGAGLEKAYSLFDDSNREKIIILFTDGKDYNSLSDPSEETRKQAEMLGEKDIPIYCVYLQNGNNDEEELKNIVNYYGENDYSAERFSTTNDPEDLSGLFLKVFYSMQHNMQYHMISPDAYGTDNFYVPSLGVSKIRICMNLQNEDTMTIDSAQNCEGTTWSNAYAEMAIYDNPDSGSWSLNVTNSSSADLYGTVVYDVNPQMNLSFEPVDGQENVYKAVAHFYDEDGQELEVDDAVSIDMESYRQSDTQSKNTYSMTTADGKAYCDTVELTPDESYDFMVHLQYSEFIDLEYSVSDFCAGKAGSVVTGDDSDGSDNSDSSVAADTSDSTKDSKGSLLLPLLLAVLVVLVVLAVLKAKNKKNNQQNFDKAIEEFRKLFKELESAYQLCVQELVTAKKLRAKAQQEHTWIKYDFSKLDHLKVDVLSKESEMNEVKKRWELVKRNMNDKEATCQSLATLNGQMKKIIGELETALSEIRSENKKLSEVIEKSRVK